MYKIIGLLLLSAIFTFVLLIPFIHLMYRLKFQRQDESKQRDIFDRTKPIFSKLHAWKVGTPNGGGILILGSMLALVLLFYAVTSYAFNWTVVILLVTLILFGSLGFYDDVEKIFGWKKTGFWGLRIRYKFLLQWLFGLFIGLLIYRMMHLTELVIPGFQTVFRIHLGWLYPVFAAFVIVATTNAFNITDGLDGLATGLLIIALLTYWVLSIYSPFADVSVFIAVTVGSLLAFLYFNIFPARIWMGDAGALSLGALLAVVALLLNEVFVLPLVGGVFVIEALSTLLQWWSKAYRHKKVLLCAPLHHHFEALGWDETKVTMRFWLAGALFAFIGLFISLLSH